MIKIFVFIALLFENAHAMQCADIFSRSNTHAQPTIIRSPFTGDELAISRLGTLQPGQETYNIPDVLNADEMNAVESLRPGHTLIFSPFLAAQPDGTTLHVTRTSNGTFFYYNIPLSDRNQARRVYNNLLAMESFAEALAPLRIPKALGYEGNSVMIEYVGATDLGSEIGGIDQATGFNEWQTETVLDLTMILSSLSGKVSRGELGDIHVVENEEPRVIMGTSRLGNPRPKFSFSFIARPLHNSVGIDLDVSDHNLFLTESGEFFLWDFFFEH